ncbi:hypothetical protein GCM10025772_09610 [Ferrimonas gelatinilytica]|uniref:Secreted protein n=1 Tax=Ferrimonas gelatinilytica TaxID=1255257 RepID=A0ABP9RZV5_9GAMM
MLIPVNLCLCLCGAGQSANEVVSMEVQDYQQDYQDAYYQLQDEVAEQLPTDLDEEAFLD